MNGSLNRVAGREDASVQEEVRVVLCKRGGITVMVIRDVFCFLTGLFMKMDLCV